MGRTVRRLRLKLAGALRGRKCRVSQKAIERAEDRSVPSPAEPVDPARRGFAAAVAAAAGFAGGLASAPRSAHAAMAVFDSSVFAQTIENVKYTAAMLAEAQRMAQELKALTTVAGIKAAAAEALGLSEPLRTLQAALKPHRIDLTEWGLPRELENPSFSSVTQTIDFLDKSLRVPADEEGVMSLEGRDSVKRRRTLAEREAAFSGYALALNQRESTEAAFNRAAGLADQASAASTLMEQQRATNNLLAAILGELVQTRAVMASVLEVNATDALKQMPLVTGSAATAGGPVVSPAAAGRGRLGE